MTPADERVLQLLQKWQRSLDLHARYADLPEDQYWLVQPWPNHQRPTKWVVDLARQRLADLQAIVKARLSAADPSLSEALELMSFLTNLVGSQHVERFVPIAEPERERELESARAPKPNAPAASPKPAVAAAPPRSAAPASPRPTTASTSTVLKPSATVKTARSGKVRTAKAPRTPDDSTITAVIKDAARLLSWGRAWHELPEAIARIAGRPGIQQVRQILRGSRQQIEERVADETKH